MVNMDARTRTDYLLHNYFMLSLRVQLKLSLGALQTQSDP